jgi:hypothetical protein
MNSNKIINTSSKRLRLFFSIIKSIPTSSKIIFLVVFLLLLNHECQVIILFQRNKFIKGVNTVFIQILYAYLTGSIFYFFVELLPKGKKQVSIFRLLNNNMASIYLLTTSLVNEVCVANDPPKEGYKMQEEEFKKKAEAINIHHTHVDTWFYPNFTFKEFVLKICFDIKEYIAQILIHSDFFDDEWLDFITRIQDTIKHIEFHLDLNGGKSTLGIDAIYIWALYGEVDRLNTLFNRYFSKYYSAHRLKNPGGSYIPKDLFFEVRKKI